jgi:hypothetical protein
MGSNFTFINVEWQEIAKAAVKAEQTALSDARTACFYARRVKHNASLKLPYQDNLSALIHEPTFKELHSIRAALEYGEVPLLEIVSFDGAQNG